MLAAHDIDDADEPSGDLARLRTWWATHGPESARRPAWIITDSDPSAMKAAVDKAIDSGCTLVLLRGEGDDTSARAAIATATGSGAAAVMDSTAGLDDLTWMRTVAGIRDQRAGAGTSEHVTAARVVLERCSERSTPVILDGVLAHAAAVQAAKDAPEAADWWLSAASSTDPAIQRAQRELPHPPAADLHLDGRGDYGLRAALALLDIVAGVVVEPDSD